MVLVLNSFFVLDEEKIASFGSSLSEEKEEQSNREAKRVKTAEVVKLFEFSETRNEKRNKGK